MRLLSEAGAGRDVAMQGAVTSLFIAARCGHLVVMRFPCETCAGNDKAMQDGATPLPW